MATGTRLVELAALAAGCTRCPLAATRTQVVFGTGDPDADLMFVGEAPGRDEDLQGVPFVGRSGQLLDRLLAEEVGIAREQVYIANVIKCRPPENRDPSPDEIAACRAAGMQAHLAKPIDAAALIAHARTNLAPYKIPKRIIFADDLPRNTAGKLLKRELRRMHAEPG